MDQLVVSLMVWLLWITPSTPAYQRSPEIYCNWPKLGICNTAIVLPAGGKAIRRLDYRLTSLRNGVQFDVDGDGTKEQTGWTAKESHLAFLALDRNGNGVIDSGRELFGVNTYPRTTGTYRERGYSAFLDDLGRAGFPVALDWRNPLYAKLLLWEDLDHNGISESNELHRFSDTYLEFANRWGGDPLVYPFGNRFHYISWARTRDDRFMDKPSVLVRNGFEHLDVPAYEIEFNLGQ